MNVIKKPLVTENNVVKVTNKYTTLEEIPFRVVIRPHSIHKDKIIIETLDDDDNIHCTAYVVLNNIGKLLYAI